MLAGKGLKGLSAHECLVLKKQLHQNDTCLWHFAIKLTKQKSKSYWKHSTTAWIKHCCFKSRNYASLCNNATNESRPPFHFDVYEELQWIWTG